eukprot:10427573-Alexandrium_andersonii.AAC.1
MLGCERGARRPDTVLPLAPGLVGGHSRDVPGRVSINSRPKHGRPPDATARTAKHSDRQRMAWKRGDAGHAS